MPLLYRILMRLAVFVLILTFVLTVAAITVLGGADFTHANWLATLAVLLGPAGLIAGVAWVVKPAQRSSG